jgi:hypothetical protein
MKQTGPGHSTSGFRGNSGGIEWKLKEFMEIPAGIEMEIYVGAGLD